MDLSLYFNSDASAKECSDESYVFFLNPKTKKITLEKLIPYDDKLVINGRGAFDSNGKSHADTFKQFFESSLQNHTALVTLYGSDTVCEMPKYKTHREYIAQRINKGHNVLCVVQDGNEHSVSLISEYDIHRHEYVSMYGKKYTAAIPIRENGSVIYEIALNR